MGNPPECGRCAGRIEAPAETVWNVMTALDKWPKWGPTVSGAELTSAGPLRLGSRGKVWTPAGVPLPFEITEFEPGRMWVSSPVWAPAYVPVLAIALPRIDGLATG
jgi:uncharacterized protein YndB with AHSA1/START domain